MTSGDNSKAIAIARSWEGIKYSYGFFLDILVLVPSLDKNFS